MNHKKNEDRISRIMNDPKRVHKIIQSAINNAMLKHKQAGNSVCGLKDGKIIWVKPQDIVIRNQ